MGLDKTYLLCYTDMGMDGMRHAYHAWFVTGAELYAFIKKKQECSTFETELAIQITECRELPFLQPKKDSTHGQTNKGKLS